MPVRKTGSLPEPIDRQVNEIIRGIRGLEEQIAKLSQGLRQQTDETEGLSNQSYLMGERLDEQESSLATTSAGLAILEAFRQSLIGLLIPSTLILPGTPGFIAPTGALLNRAEWPVFWQHVESGGNIVSDQVWHDEKRYYSYSYGDGETTFRIPMIYDFVRGYDPANGVPMGQWVEDTLRSHQHGTQLKVSTSPDSHVWDDLGAGIVPKGTVERGVGASDASGTMGYPNTLFTGDEETAPKHGTLPYYIYTGEVG